MLIRVQLVPVDLKTLSIDNINLRDIVREGIKTLDQRITAMSWI